MVRFPSFLWFLFWFGLLTAPAQKFQPMPHTFTNPIVKEAADPWIVYWHGDYYMTFTQGDRVTLRKSATLAGLGQAPDVTVWHGGGPGFETYKEDVWAPEIHLLKNHWYIYYTATDGPDDNRRIFALESKTDDPQSEYTFKGKVAVPNDDHYAIDATAHEDPHGKLYLLWSGRALETGGAQGIYIAPMSNPWTISGPRICLSTPQYDWEKHGWWVNEGPAVLSHNGKIFVTYSASGGTTPDYCLGLLTNSDGNLMNAASWHKSPQPVFARYDGPDGHVYTPGHNGFFQSPDGKQDWIVYHGKENTDGAWDGRAGYAQPFTWDADGTPHFGHPIPAGIPIPVPSGEKSH